MGTPTATPSFKVRPDDIRLISLIADRAIILAEKLAGAHLHKEDTVMDLTACIANGCPLKLVELLKAPDSQFGHDVFGIRRYLDRSTGQLTDCFLPRYAL